MLAVEDVTDKCEFCESDIDERGGVLVDGRLACYDCADGEVEP